MNRNSKGQFKKEKENEMDTIVKKTLAVNGNIFVTYDGLKNVSDTIKNKYKDQGEVYEKFLGVSRKDAMLAGWHPNDTDFSIECDGWKRMLNDNGKITKTETIETIPVYDILFPKK